MISDVPVGVFLSGGVDSALVAAMARDAAVENGVDVPRLLLLVLKETPMLEIDDAAETARILGLPHKSIRVDTEQLWQKLFKIVNHLEEPVASPSALALWDLVHFAKKDVTVVLAGQGSDEPWEDIVDINLNCTEVCCPIVVEEGRYLSLLDDVSEEVPDSILGTTSGVFRSNRRAK